MLSRHYSVRETFAYHCYFFGLACYLYYAKYSSITISTLPIENTVYQFDTYIHLSRFHLRQLTKLVSPAVSSIYLPLPEKRRTFRFLPKYPSRLYMYRLNTVVWRIKKKLGKLRG